MRSCFMTFCSVAAVLLNPLNASMHALQNSHVCSVLVSEENEEPIIVSKNMQGEGELREEKQEQAVIVAALYAPSAKELMVLSARISHGSHKEHVSGGAFCRQIPHTLFQCRLRRHSMDCR